LTPLKTNFLILFFLISIDLFAQDFYDHGNSLKFGEYLYNSNQYDLAAREFERCVFLKPDDRESFVYLFKIHRKENAFDKAIDCYKRYSGNLNYNEMDSTFGSEYFKLLIQNEKYRDAASFLNVNPLYKADHNLMLSTILLRKEWKEADQFTTAMNGHLNKSLTEITSQGLALKKKSPALAGLFSAVLPGSGKVYSGRWKDGVISFLMTSTSAFVAVRGFNKNPNSFYPWAMGTMAVVYYSGNIYGSAQAALKYNKYKEDELVNKTRGYILGGY
jgi:tetratricopeptide (TPR) repeat protein